SGNFRRAFTENPPGRTRAQGTFRDSEIGKRPCKKGESAQQKITRLPSPFNRFEKPEKPRKHPFYYGGRLCFRIDYEIAECQYPSRIQFAWEATEFVRNEQKNRL